MATGSIKSIEIEASGWVAAITVEGVSTGGTYDFGLGVGNDPANAKIVIDVLGEGYSNAAVLGTKTRTLQGMATQNPDIGALRKVFPDQASPDETVSGDDVIIKIPLSNPVYNDDITVVANVLAGWYTQDGNASLAASGVSVTNNSTLDYPRVVGNWAVRQCQTFGTVAHIEFSAFHKFAENGRPVACVVFTATDGTHTVTQTVTEMAVSADSPISAISTYPADMDLSTMTDLSVVTFTAVAYPWVGDANSILNTNDGVNTFPTPLYCNLQGRVDKNDVHGKCVVSSAGNDATGAVYATRALAEAGNAYLTIAAALTALAAYNNTNAGHNDAGGGIIYCVDGTYTINTANGGTGMKEWVTITPATGATKAGVIIQAAANNAAMPYRLQLSGVTFSGTTYLLSGATKCVSFHDCILATTSTSYTVYGFGYGSATNNTGSTPRGFGEFSTNAMNWGLVRGNDMSISTACIGFCVLGNRNVRIGTRTNVASATPLNDNLVYAFNITGAGSVITQMLIADRESIVHGVAIIQNLIIRYGAQTETLVSISADATVTNTNNVLLHNNTFVGARCNLGYNDTATGGPYPQLNWSIKNNIFSNYNNKDDTYQDNPDATGGWPVGYGVGHSGNHFRSSAGGEFFGECTGQYFTRGSFAVPLQPLYVTDNSSDGANTSGGDYHLQAASPCWAITRDLVTPFDMEGHARAATSASGVYARTYSVTYNGNGNTGGTVPVDATAYFAGGAATVLGNTGSLVKTGYRFVSWNTAANGTGTSYAPASAYTIIDTNVVLYAQYAQEHSVTYNGNGNTSGTVPVDSNKYIVGETAVVLDNTGSLVKNAAAFYRWNTAADGSGDNYSPDSSVLIASSDITMYAQYSAPAQNPIMWGNLWGSTWGGLW
jgi:hypothetical protein